MALQLKDRVRTACTTVGTGNIIVGSNRAGFQNWDAITNGNTVYYCIVEGNAWEVGHGVKTDGNITRNLIASSTGSLIDLKGTEDVFETYPAEKAVILDVDGNLNVDGDIFADNLYTKTQTDTLLDSKANVGDSYTKAETYNNTEIDSKLFEKADKTTTYTKAEIDSQQLEQDAEITANTADIETNTGNISSNTTAIGTLSGRVSVNEQDIATLQDGIFFSSSYSADYPSSPNRDPETGNMYMQNLSAFTYSYADTNQVFLSKTDEQGNVRQFTAVKPDDTIVLNQVESPNYGRYKVISVNDLGTYANIIVEFQIGEGTLLEGDTVALQAFPASAGGGGGGGTVADGCIYLNNQTIISDYTIPTGKNGMSAGAIKFDGTVTVPTGSAYHVVDSDEDSLWTESGGNTIKYTSAGNTTVIAEANSGKYATYQVDNADQKYSMQIRPDQDNAFVIRNETTGQNSMSIATDGSVSTTQDMTVNGVTVGKGIGSSVNNTIIGKGAFANNTNGDNNVAVGILAMRDNKTGSSNTAIGRYAGLSNVDGSENTYLGNNAGNKNVSGQYNTAVGVGALLDNNGTFNTALGKGALNKNVSGEGNTAIGADALYNNEGNGNIAIGYRAGNGMTGGFNNILIGDSVQASTPSTSNEVVIGNDSVTKTRLKGVVNSTGTYSNVSTGGTPNVHIGTDGTFYRSTATTYTAEEMDKKLEIIEKLEARLTKLEARIK